MSTPKKRSPLVQAMHDGPILPRKDFDRVREGLAALVDATDDPTLEEVARRVALQIEHLATTAADWAEAEETRATLVAMVERSVRALKPLEPVEARAIEADLRALIGAAK